MFFVAAKLLSFFLSPFNGILLLLVISFLIRRASWKRTLRITALALFLIFSNRWLQHKALLAYQAPPVQKPTHKSYAAGIVLGGFLGYDRVYQKPFFGGAADRFIQIFQLYRQGIIRKIIITGGNGELWYRDYKEADWVKLEFEKMGVSATDILIDNQSRNTFENAAEAKKILEKAGFNGKVLLITSAHHIPRAAAVFEKAGITCDAYPCAFIESHNPLTPGSYFIPSLEAMQKWDILLKEWFGLLAYRLTGKA